MWAKIVLAEAQVDGPSTDELTLLSTVCYTGVSPTERLKMGHTYSQEEIEILEKDLDKIQEKWNEYVLSRLNGRDGDSHNPPALNRATVELLDHVLQNYTQAGDGEMEITSELFAGFAANMFAFGQWATKNGLNITDMYGCKCSTVTDEDIAKILRG